MKYIGYNSVVSVLSLLVMVFMLALGVHPSQAAPGPEAAWGVSQGGVETLTNKTITSGTLGGITVITGTLEVNADITGTSIMTQSGAAAAILVAKQEAIASGTAAIAVAKASAIITSGTSAAAGIAVAKAEAIASGTASIAVAKAEAIASGTAAIAVAKAEAIASGTAAIAAAPFYPLPSGTALAATVSTATETLAAVPTIYAPLTRINAVAPAFSGTVAINGAAGGTFDITATGDFVITSPTGTLVNGMDAMIRVHSTGTAASVCTLDGTFLPTNTLVTTGTISTASGTWSIIRARYNSTNTAWQVYDVQTGF